jgi:hypothetical protein
MTSDKDSTSNSRIDTCDYACGTILAVPARCGGPVDWFTDTTTWFFFVLLLPGGLASAAHKHATTWTMPSASTNISFGLCCHDNTFVCASLPRSQKTAVKSPFLPGRRSFRALITLVMTRSLNHDWQLLSYLALLGKVFKRRAYGSWGYLT